MRSHIAFPLTFAAFAAACGVDLTESARCEPTAWTVAAQLGDTVVTSTGLRFIEQELGTGAVAEWCTPLAVHYALRRLDESLIEDTRSFGSGVLFTPGRPRLITTAGLHQGVIGMREHGLRRLIVPPELGYGSQERRNAVGEIIIEANSTLIYDLELLAVGQ